MRIVERFDVICPEKKLLCEAVGGGVRFFFFSFFLKNQIQNIVFKTSYKNYIVSSTDMKKFFKFLFSSNKSNYWCSMCH